MKKQINTPEPNVKEEQYCGYTDDFLKTFMDEKEFNALGDWLTGQTCAVAPDGRIVTYECDVLRFRELYHNGTKTYFD